MEITIEIISKANYSTWKPHLIQYFEQEVVIKQPEKRAAQAIAIAHIDNEIVGVATAYKQYNTNLREDFLYYRSSVSPKARNQSVSRQLISAVINYCNESYKPGFPVGIFFEVENKAIMASLTTPVWKSGAVFIGYDKHNRQQRVIYFDNATLGQNDHHQEAVKKN